MDLSLALSDNSILRHSIGWAQKGYKDLRQRLLRGNRINLIGTKDVSPRSTRYGAASGGLWVFRLESPRVLCVTMNRVKVTHIFFGFGSPFSIGRALRGVRRPNPRRANCHYRQQPGQPGDGQPGDSLDVPHTDTTTATNIKSWEMRDKRCGVQSMVDCRPLNFPSP